MRDCKKHYAAMYEVRLGNADCPFCTTEALRDELSDALAVLDAARAWKKHTQEIIDGDFTISCPADFLDSWEMDLYEAIRNLDKEVER